MSKLLSKFCAIRMYWLPRLPSTPLLYPGLWSLRAYLQIWMRAESNGTYWSWKEHTRAMFLNHSRPGSCASLNKHVSSTEFWSDIES